VPTIADDDLIPVETIAAYESYCSERRQELIPCLADIAGEVTAALANAGISIPIYLTIPSSGHAFVSVMTPDDPADEIWYEVGKVIRDIVSERIGVDHLYSQSLACASACAERAA
jgi:hypothetical protein